MKSFLKALILASACAALATPAFAQEIRCMSRDGLSLSFKVSDFLKDGEKVVKVSDLHGNIVSQEYPMNLSKSTSTGEGRQDPISDWSISAQATTNTGRAAHIDLEIIVPDDVSSATPLSTHLSVDLPNTPFGEVSAGCCVAPGKPSYVEDSKSWDCSDGSSVNIRD